MALRLRSMGDESQEGAQPQGDSRAGYLERPQQRDALLSAKLVLKWHAGSCLLWWICL